MYSMTRRQAWRTIAVPSQEALEAHLAPYAAHSAQSRGRRYPEAGAQRAH